MEHLFSSPDQGLETWMSVYSLMQILLHWEQQTDVFGVRLFHRFINNQEQFCLGFFMSLLCVLALLCGYWLWNYHQY